MNYFELLGVPTQFSVNKDTIVERYRELQKQYHPDRFATAQGEDKLAVMQKASQINDAYTTLKHPVYRAVYLLKLRGVDIQHETKTLQDPQFLMQQMELRERLEDLPQADDMFSAVVDFEDEVNEHIAELTRQLADDLNNQRNEDAAMLTRKLKFMYKLLSELERLEDEQVEF